MKLLEGPGLIIVLVIVLIIFGPKQLPELGKTLGKTMKSIREGMDDATAEPAEKDAAVAEAKASSAKTEQ